MDLGRIVGRTPRRVTDQPREAAVVVPVIEGSGGPRLLFTKRADDLADHPGQMSFPGGGREPEDRDVHDTALREANEEIGLRRDEVTHVGPLDDIRTVTEYSVTPFVVEIPDRAYTPDYREVAEITTVPVSELLDPDNYEMDRRDHPYYGEIVIHHFHVDGYTVWGATGRIVVQLLELTTDWRAPERLDPDPEG